MGRSAEARLTDRIIIRHLRLVNSTPAGGGGQNGGQSFIPAGGITSAGSVSNPNSANVSHKIQLSINEAWPPPAQHSGPQTCHST